MNQIFGRCKECNDGTEVRLVSRAKGLCLHHYRIDQVAKAKERAKKKKEEKGYSGIKAQSENQKEIDKEDVKFFRAIWRKRKHVSEVSGELLGDKMERFFMSHILVKKLYPHYRHNDENILLMTKAEHFQWEFGTVTGEKWEKVKQLQQRLREEYNQKEREGSFE